MRFLILIFSSISLLFSLTLKSPDITNPLNKNLVYNKFGCSGLNISPQLIWANPPKNTKSYAITVFDPDAPIEGGWWHWIVINIPKNINKIKRGASKKDMPKGSIELENSYGEVGFGGACPPKYDKAHHYIFTIYALNVDKLPIKENSTIEDVISLIKAHTIAKSSIVSTYKR